MDSLGVALKNIPLAHFETEALGQTIRLANAWPLEVSAPGAIEICHYPAMDDPVMVFIPRGSGGALVIGDSQFLLNGNLEGLDDWHAGNIMFLRELFEWLRAYDAGPPGLDSSGLGSSSPRKGGPE
jgi:hypothetical protein